MQIMHTKKDFEIKEIGEYHGLYVQSDTLLAEAFENFRKLCLKIFELDSAKCLSAPVLAWQAALKKRSKIGSFN